MLKSDMTRYLDLRHSAGFKLTNEGYLLQGFITFAESQNDHFIQADHAVAWASQAPSPAQRNRRLSVIRHFAQHLQAEDAKHEVPPRDAFGNIQQRRPTPYIFSKSEVSNLIKAAGQLKPEGSIRPIMMATLFGMLAATGLRISEALALRVQDVTVDGIMILETKFQKSRLVPLHPTMRAELDRYLEARSQLVTSTDVLFIGINGTAPKQSGLRDAFHGLLRTMSLQNARNGGYPHIHDLRHTFAVRSLEQCRGDRDAVSRHMTALSTYLGHTNITGTYWYLEATPVLLSQIAELAEMRHRENGK